MLAIVWRGSAWVAGWRTADAAGIASVVGAGFGALVGWLGASGVDRMDRSATAASIGAAMAGALALVVRGVCRSVTMRCGPGSTPEKGLLDEFRALTQAQIRSQWRVLLDGRDRLDTTFTCYRRIAPPRSFTGSMRQRSDLLAALDAAAPPDGGPRLLVVGPGGHGKTVALLDAAQHLADRHRDRFGTPVLLNLGSWRQDDHDLMAWMVRELCSATGPLPGADETVTRWAATGRVAPILDGLDEIPDPRSREHCVAAINAFIDRSVSSTAVIVASRPAEYTAVTTDGAARLAVNAAISLERLSPRRAAARLERLDAPGATYLTGLVRDAPTHPAVEVLRVPLWLWISSTLDRADAERLAGVTSDTEARRLLTDAYLARSIDALHRQVGVSVSTCRRVLAAIAGFLADPRGPDSTTFRLENLTPAQPARAQVRAASVTGGLVFGVVSGLAVGRPLPGAIAGVPLGLIGQRVFDVQSDGRAARSRLRRPGLRSMVHAPTGGFLGSLLVALAGGLVLWLTTGPTAGLIAGVALWLIYGLVDGLLASNVVVSDTIDEGRRASWTSMALHVGMFGPLGGLTLWLVGGTVLGLVVGTTGALVVGTALGLNRGGWYLVMQRRVRRDAAQRGLLPRSPAPFIVAAIDSGILRRTGGGVQFRHGFLADRLAEEAPEPGLIDLRQRVGTDPATDSL